jgi:Fur family transcriptional regulator, peroxide stress response regulator
LDSSEIERRVAEFVDACRRQGIKATHQRTEILRELVATQEHPDAETIYDRVRQRIPTISLDTVYRTLRMLEDMGAISRVGSIRDRTRFDANTDRHHHFICCECGKIGDFFSDALDRFPVPREVSEMGSVDWVYVELRGRCQECQRRESQPGGKSRETR